MTPSTDQLKTLSEAAKQAALLAGEVLLKWLGETVAIEKGPSDLVTQADFESQTVIRDYLLDRFPDHRFIGEESIGVADEAANPPAPHPSTGPEFCWIVDPLDGTTNFVHQLRSFSVSIGLLVDGVSIVGVVYDPVLKEMYAAVRGGGATLNDAPIQVSDCRELKRALVIFSFGRGTDRHSPDTSRFLNMLEAVGSIRRLGSAALNLCYVACGRVDAYWATSLAKWDVAAGWLIAQEAGAEIGDFRGHELSLEAPCFCAASTSELFEHLQPVLDVEAESRAS